MAERTCGSCTMCCKLLGVKELAKPAGKWCPHCNIGHGCQIYSDRPNDCRIFECVWLQEDTFDDDMRPDLTHVVMFTPKDSRILQVHVDPARPNAWEEGKTGLLINSFIGIGYDAAVTIGERRFMLTGSQEKAAFYRKKVAESRKEVQLG